MSFIDSYIKHAVKTCDAPEIFHKFMARTAIGIIARNKVYLQFGANKIYNHIWMLFLADSTTFRKSTAMRIGLRIVDRVDETLRYPVGFSPESLWPTLEKQPSGFFFYSEFKAFADMLAQKYMGGADAFLTDLYDVPDVPLRRELKSAVYRITTPTISIEAASTFSWFLKSMLESDIESGYIPRWLIVPAKTKEHDYPYPPDEDETEVNELVRKLHDIYEYIGLNSKVEGQGESKPIKMSFDPAAREEYIKWSSGYEKNIDTKSLLSPCFSRLITYAQKFSMIEALNDMSHTILKKHFDASLELINYVADSLAEMQKNDFTFTDYSKIHKKIRDAILSKPCGIERSEVYDMVGHNIKGQDIDQVVKSLVTARRIVIKDVKKAGADKHVVYYIPDENRMGG